MNKSKEIVLEHLLGGGANNVCVPLLLQKLRRTVHPCESVSTGVFSLPSLDGSVNDGGWQWKLQVYPMGQSNHPDKLIVYLILTDVKGPSEATAANSSVDEFRVLQQRLFVTMSLRYDHKGDTKTLVDMKTQMFDWNVKPARWTRHEFTLNDVLRWSNKATLVCKINEHKLGRDRSNDNWVDHSERNQYRNVLPLARTPAITVSATATDTHLCANDNRSIKRTNQSELNTSRNNEDGLEVSSLMKSSENVKRNEVSALDVDQTTVGLQQQNQDGWDMINDVDDDIAQPTVVSYFDYLFSFFKSLFK